MLLLGKLDESTARVSSKVSLVSCRAGIFFVLNIYSADAVGLGPTERDAGSGQPTAVKGDERR